MLHRTSCRKCRSSIGGTRVSRCLRSYGVPCRRVIVFVAFVTFGSVLDDKIWFFSYKTLRARKILRNCLPGCPRHIAFMFTAYLFVVEVTTIRALIAGHAYLLAAIGWQIEWAGDSAA